MLTQWFLSFKNQLIMHTAPNASTHRFSALLLRYGQRFKSKIISKKIIIIVSPLQKSQIWPPNQWWQEFIQGKEKGGLVGSHQRGLACEAFVHSLAQTGVAFKPGSEFIVADHQYQIWIWWLHQKLIRTRACYGDADKQVGFSVIRLDLNLEIHPSG